MLSNADVTSKAFADLCPSDCRASRLQIYQISSSRYSGVLENTCQIGRTISGISWLRANSCTFEASTLSVCRNRSNVAVLTLHSELARQLFGGLFLMDRKSSYIG